MVCPVKQGDLVEGLGAEAFQQKPPELYIRFRVLGLLESSEPNSMTYPLKLLLFAGRSFHFPLG